MILRDDEWREKRSDDAHFFHGLPFYKLLPQDALLRPADFIYDYTFEELDRDSLEYADICPSASTLSRLGAVLPRFVNFKSISTALSQVVIVNMPLDKHSTCEDWNIHEEANTRNKSCLPIAGPENKKYSSPMVLPAFHDLAAIMSPQISAPTPVLMLTNLDLTM